MLTVRLALSTYARSPLVKYDEMVIWYLKYTVRLNNIKPCVFHILQDFLRGISCFPDLPVMLSIKFVLGWPQSW